MSNFVTILLSCFSALIVGIVLGPAVGSVVGMAVVLLVVTGLQVANADAAADADADASADQPRCHGAIDCRSSWYVVQPFIWSQFDASSIRKCTNRHPRELFESSNLDRPH